MGWAQSKKDKLQQEKSAAQKRINEVQQILEQTSVKRKTSTGQLNALSKQIEAHSTLINSISAELNFLQSQITQDNVVINALENDLVNLKKEYGAMVYAAYKSHNSYDKLTFLFSSKTFNQLVMRLKYMEQYSKARKAQVRLIGQVKEKLVAERKGLEERRAERSSLLAEQQSKNQKLLTLRKQENKMLGELKSRESELKKEIAQKKDDVARLEKMIASIISAEIKKTATAENKSPAVEIDLSNITASFEKNKANLPWPVNSGFISEHFGTHPHPVYKRIKVPNDGVNIQTKQNEKVRAVFKGTVKKVAVIPGMKYVVIVQHGNYFTVYARLREVSVKMGQEIEINDEIGEVNTDKDGVTEIQFQVWKNTTKLDPELWLAKR
jgi:septal ring factor EnvC (AmiA/AmiB activator)